MAPVEDRAAQLEDDLDLAVAAYADEDDDWSVVELEASVTGDLDDLLAALRSLPGDLGVIAMVAVDEDFFVIVRVEGPRVSVMLSDVTAADDWDLAASVVDFLGLPEPDDDDDSEPVGELDLLDDLGVTEGDLLDLLDDDEAYPDEVLADVARELGFGELFDEVVGLSPA
ncbi:tRNA adenosine deaminase-associated protein [Nocardioides acrostichi]|uniref:tRNA adenosine deaminase-associated protein n=1 Tax=Nocardioides acrostichi TaxID=2784339 RepID=A0A930YCH9_9ACTN|nr:tRNA adenosine deaminase-associated protein [Nocardioides acrostichi]MBF4163508.1 tRNA adenosine deaminase-associated protein [Nocardioides acrostichi]